MEAGVPVVLVAVHHGLIEVEAASANGFQPKQHIICTCLLLGMQQTLHHRDTASGQSSKLKYSELCVCCCFMVELLYNPSTPHVISKHHASDYHDDAAWRASS